jgi:hypothetical protein
MPLFLNTLSLIQMKRQSDKLLMNMGKFLFFFILMLFKNRLNEVNIFLYRPVAVSVDASSAFQSYAGGVFDGVCTTSSKT